MYYLCKATYSFKAALNGSEISGASSESTHSSCVISLFAFIGFPHAHNSAALIAGRPDNDDHSIIKMTNGDVAPLSIILSCAFDLYKGPIKYFITPLHIKATPLQSFLLFGLIIENFHHLLLLQ